MPCDRDPTHDHTWPPKTSPTEIDIDRCERYCYFCTGERRNHKYKQAGHLRAHVRERHCEGGLLDYAHLTVRKARKGYKANYEWRVGQVRVKNPRKRKADTEEEQETSPKRRKREKTAIRAASRSGSSSPGPQTFNTAGQFYQSNENMPRENTGTYEYLPQNFLDAEFALGLDPSSAVQNANTYMHLDFDRNINETLHVSQIEQILTRITDFNTSSPGPSRDAYQDNHKVKDPIVCRNESDDIPREDVQRAGQSQDASDAPFKGMITDRYDAEVLQKLERIILDAVLFAHDSGIEGTDALGLFYSWIKTCYSEVELQAESEHSK
ncbi:hypothetical protein M501DRAFT_1061548 [Patellaria atrata CBS 101060]|uniref:Uncharacterized protein n=1 Tax=Patellaria atrata CBS 101060 TaxID=1346257 RepID=A0A9P4S3Y6_9PEZI|nr:hypothetical protein M501DRAFT_1061548 [Patellaria atrata CBS 101060]